MSDITGESAGAEHLHGREPHSGSMIARLNWLRAGVLGANDGIISTAGLVLGVADEIDCYLSPAPAI